MSKYDKHYDKLISNLDIIFPRIGSADDYEYQLGRLQALYGIVQRETAAGRPIDKIESGILLEALAARLSEWESTLSDGSDKPAQELVAKIREALQDSGDS